MSRLSAMHCKPLPKGSPSVDAGAARKLLAELASGWAISSGGSELVREFRFQDFYRTMSFVNAVAYIANAEDHHPDLEVGYNRCKVRYSTHSVGGLSENDFICAAKIDDLGA